MTATACRPRAGTPQTRASLVLLAAFLAPLATVLGIAPAAVLPAAVAATCPSSEGVSVVVDYRELGGGIATGCVADGGGRSAASIFQSAGVAITYATRQPGFVCRVNGVPTSDPCVNASPADAYWGLWWSDGGTASWTYSSQGVGGLTVPAGGSVAWSWQQDREGGSVPPGIGAPMPRSTSTSSPTPSPTSSPTPTRTPTPSPTSSPTRTQQPSPQQPSPQQPSPQPTAPSGGGGSTSGPSTDGPSGGSTQPGSPAVSPTPGTGSSSGAASPSAERTSPTGKPSAGATATTPPDDDAEVAGPQAAESPTEAGTEAGTTSETALSDAPRAGAAQADRPTRVPAWASWGILVLLAAAVAVSAAVARRRRGV